MTALLMYVRSLLKYAAKSRAVDDAEVTALPWVTASTSLTTAFL